MRVLLVSLVVITGSLGAMGASSPVLPSYLHAFLTSCPALAPDQTCFVPLGLNRQARCHYP